MQKYKFKISQSMIIGIKYMAETGYSFNNDDV